MLIPLNIRKIAAAIAKSATIRIGIKRLCSVFLKELKRATGPAKDSGKAPAKYFRPLISSDRLVCFIIQR